MRDGGAALQAALHGERLVSPHKTTAVMRTSQVSTIELDGRLYARNWRTSSLTRDAVARALSL